MIRIRRKIFFRVVIRLLVLLTLVFILISVTLWMRSGMEMEAER